MKFNILLPFTLALLGVFNTAVAEPLKPVVLEYYPACEYRVLDHVSASRKISAVNNNFTESNLALSFAKAKADIVKKAVKLGADGVLLTSRTIAFRDTNSVRRVNEKRHYVKVNADLITVCDDRPGQNKLRAPVSPDGKVIAAGSRSSDDDQMQLSFDVEMIYPDKPSATDNVFEPLISLDSGIYGIPLGSSTQAVLAYFGSPSIRLAFSGSRMVLAYGRSHWFYFQHNKLEKVSNSSSILSASIMNQVPFDDRFDQGLWYSKVQGLGRVSSGTADSPALSGLSNATSELLFHLSSYSNKDGKKRVVEGVTLQSKTFKWGDYYLETGSSVIDQNTQLNLWLEEKETLSSWPVKELPITVSSVVYLKNGDRLEILSPQLYVHVSGEEVDKIVMTESIFPHINDRNPTPGVRLDGMGIYDDATELLNDERVFETYNQLEIDYSNYTKRVSFDEDGGVRTAYAIEFIKRY